MAGGPKRTDEQTDAGAAGDGAGHGHDGVHLVTREKGWGLVLLAFSALGIIYGDIGTSPLYAYQAVFTAPPTHEEVLSAASLFFWTLTLIVLVKYVGIIIRFDDNGEGGTFALYSLMCRAAGFTPFGPAQPEELQLTGLPLGLWGHWWSLANDKGAGLRRSYARSRGLQVALLLVVMLATAMVVGDGVLTPSISVLSAVSGLKVAIPSMQQGEIIGIAIVVLVVLFSVQYMGTAKISAVFAPIITVWLLFNAAIGFANLSVNGWGVWQAISPHYGIAAFTGPGGFDAGWRLLAGVMLAITGAEAMYADLGHFNARAVTLSFCGLVYPCLVVTYMGQASYLAAHPDAYTDPFWKSVPSGAFWPMLVVATAASVVASQALISGVYSIMRQAMNLSVFPPMKVTNTDVVTEGQIYIRSINWMLMLGCVAMVAGFQDTTALGHAYGVAVMSVMFITTILAGIVMLVCYGINPLLVALFLIFFVPLEGLFLSSNIIKIPEGGWVTIMIAVIVATVNVVWWFGSAAKSRWYKAQAARNKGLLAQLGSLEEQEEDTQNAQPLISGAAAGAVSRRRHQPTSSLTDGTTQWTPQAAGQGSSITAGRLGSMSTPTVGGVTRQAPVGVSGVTAVEGGGVPGVAAVHGQLVAQSWCAGSGARGTSGGGAVLFDSKPLTRLAGLSIIYTQATSGLPAVLQHLLINMPVLHEVMVLLTVRIITRPFASQEERFLVRRSNTLGGAYRVIVRYGYMEQVDHGPQFVKQLISCLVRYTASQQSNMLHTGHRPTEDTPFLQLSSTHAGDAAAAAGVAGSSGLGRASSSAVVIELQPVDEAAPDRGDGGGGLARWSRVPVSAADTDLMSEVTSSGKNLAVRSIQASMLSPRPSMEVLTSGKSLSPRHSGPLSVPSNILGRESLNRRQYSLQKVSARKHTAMSASAGGSTAPPSALHGVSTVAGTVAGTAAGAADGTAVLPGVCTPVPTGVSQQLASAGGTADGIATVSMSGSSQSAGAGSGEGAGSLGGLSADQVSEIELLLSCLRHRAVYIMGRTQLVAAQGVVQGEGGDASAAGGDGRARRGVGAVGRAAGHYGRGLLTGAYRVLANNTHPSSQSWRLPDEQLVLVSMVVRI